MKKICVFLITLFLCSSSALALENLHHVTPTPLFVDFIGWESLLNSDPLPVGTEIIAKDPDGVVCGSFTVHTEGEYGILHVYGDDSKTAEDEGALPGDIITFYINGQPASILFGDSTWTFSGDLKTVEIRGIPEFTTIGALVALTGGALAFGFLRKRR